MTINKKVTTVGLTKGRTLRMKRPARTSQNIEIDNWTSAYEARTDLLPYGDNSLAIFALALRFRIEDLESVAANSITDGSDDKKCDLIYIDRDEGKAVIAQCYRSVSPKEAAPSNKASDLNTAISWVLQRPLNELPDKIRSSAEELREAIKSGQINSINLWYIHNCRESRNVQDELKTLQQTADSIFRRHYADNIITAAVLEVGSGIFSKWYHESLSPILVNEDFSINTSNAFEISGPGWKAVVAPISARFLRKAYRTYRTNIFSANIRDYLGSRQSDSNINNGIKNTATDQPENFWVFNNGVTILCHRVSIKAKKIGTTLQIKGMSIVNGAPDHRSPWLP